MLKSNIAACHLKLAEWKEAVVAADAALEGIERVTTAGAKQKSDGKSQQQENTQEEEEDDDGSNNDAHTNPPTPKNDDAAAASVVELDPSLDEATALAHVQQRDAHHAAISRIKTKSLMRRARAKSELGGWANLQAALDDYTSLSNMPSAEALPPQDKKIIQAALRELPLKVARAREAEMGEMMGKLKELGNSVLKPFGLSTDMFKMQKDERTGGYSMSINQEN